MSRIDPYIWEAEHIIAQQYSSSWLYSRRRRLIYKKERTLARYGFVTGSSIGSAVLIILILLGG